MLVQIVDQHRRAAEEVLDARPLVQAAIQHDVNALEHGLHQEMEREIRRDREYWAPLKRQLEQLRRAPRL